MSQNQLFRKAALEKMASPEQLDLLMKVTSPRGWIALFTTGAILAGAVVWSVFGSIPTRVAGEGILAAGTYFSIESDANGQLTELFVEDGQVVDAGQVVATIDQPNLEEDIENARDNYDLLNRDYSQSRRDHNANVTGWDTTIANLDSLITTEEQRRDEKTRQLDDPNYPRNRVQREIDAIVSTIADRNVQIEQVRQNKRNSEQRLAGMLREVETARNRFETLSSRESRYSQVTSNVAGKILDVQLRRGDTVREGQVLARLLQEYSDGMQALFFIDSAQGAEIRPGMIVEVSPTTIKKEEYGFLKGEVLERSPEPLTRAQLLRELGGNEDRASKILEGGPVYMILALLSPAETPTGYAWSSGDGPPLQLVGNQDISVNVITRTRAPYTLVLPIVRRSLGAT